MFGLIRKKKVISEIEEIMRVYKKAPYGDFEKPISEKQKILNAYGQGYQHGSANFYNALKNFLFRIRTKI